MMRRGCIAVGEIRCDGCGHTIKHPEHYLAVDEEERLDHYCVDCCLKKGYADYKKEKGVNMLTFFPEPDIVE